MQKKRTVERLPPTGSLKDVGQYVFRDFVSKNVNAKGEASFHSNILAAKISFDEYANTKKSADVKFDSFRKTVDDISSSIETVWDHVQSYLRTSENGFFNDAGNGDIYKKNANLCDEINEGFVKELSRLMEEVENDGTSPLARANRVKFAIDPTAEQWKNSTDLLCAVLKHAATLVYISSSLPHQDNWKYKRGLEALVSDFRRPFHGSDLVAWWLKNAKQVDYFHVTAHGFGGIEHEPGGDLVAKSGRGSRWHGELADTVGIVIDEFAVPVQFRGMGFASALRFAENRVAFAKAPSVLILKDARRDMANLTVARNALGYDAWVPIMDETFLRGDKARNDHLIGQAEANKTPSAGRWIYLFSKEYEAPTASDDDYVHLYFVPPLARARLRARACHPPPGFLGHVNIHPLLVWPLVQSAATGYCMDRLRLLSIKLDASDESFFDVALTLREKVRIRLRWDDDIAGLVLRVTLAPDATTSTYRDAKFRQVQITFILELVKWLLEQRLYVTNEKIQVSATFMLYIKLPLSNVDDIDAEALKMDIEHAPSMANSPMTAKFTTKDGDDGSSMGCTFTKLPLRYPVKDHRSGKK